MTRPRALDPDDIRAHLDPQAGPWTELRCLPQTGSTNADARAVALIEGAWSLVVADAQQQGRGRIGARWHSPAGTAIHLSLVTSLTLPVHLWPRASLVVGAAAAAELTRLTGARLWLKWPNDLMIRGRNRWLKLGGILCERSDMPGQPARWIAGIGVNVSTPLAAFPTSLRPHIGTLAMFGEPPPREALVAALASAVRSSIARWVAAAGRLDAASIEQQLLFVGEEIQVDLQGDGNEDWVHLRGLAADGGLRVAPTPIAPAEQEYRLEPIQITAARSEPPWHAAPRLAPIP